MTPGPTFRSGRISGFTLVELKISMTLVTVILIATAASLQREVENVADLQRLSNAVKGVVS